MVGYIDGCCKGNPGPGGIGGHARFDNGFNFRFFRAVGHTTNNEAEYLALIEMLEQIISNADNISKNEPIIIRSDSQLVINQMLGEYTVKNERILKHYYKAKDLISCLSNKVIFEKVSRSENTLADQLANTSLRHM